MKAMATQECDEETLPVTCGNQTGVLYARLFLCPGIHQECIKVNDQLVTPKMFSVMGDKEKLKDWKNAIRLRGVSVRKLMDTGELNYYNHKELCSGKCVSRNMGGSKYDIARFERDHELPLFPPLIAAMEQSSPRPRDMEAVSQPVFPMATAISVSMDSDGPSEEAEEDRKSKSSSPAPLSSPMAPSPSAPTPPKLSGAAKRKSKTVKKEITNPRAESPLELNTTDSLASSCASPLSLQADDASHINDPYLQRALLGLADCNLNECFIKQEPQEFAEDLTAKSALVAKAMVSKMLSMKSVNGHSASPSPSPNSNGNNTPNNNCDDYQLSHNVDHLLSLDIKEESQEFWRGVMDLGLINDFFREIKNSLDVLKNDLIKGRAQQEDSQKVSDIVNSLGLVTKLKWKLAGKKPDGEGQKEKSPVEFPSVKRKMVESDQKRDVEKRHDCYGKLLEIGVQKSPTDGIMRSFYDTNGGSSSAGSYCSDNEDVGDEPQDLSCARKRQRQVNCETFDNGGPPKKVNGSLGKFNNSQGAGSLKNGLYQGAVCRNGHFELTDRNGDDRAAKKRRKNVAHRAVVSYE